MPLGSYDPGALRAAFAAADLAQAQARAASVAMTPRQVELNHRRAYFEAEAYDNRLVAWSGLRVPKLEERDGIMRQTVIPPGFYSPTGEFDHVPMEHRRPIVQQHLVREIVLGFTDLMFGEEQVPVVSVEGDDEATAWIADMFGSTSWWQRWAEARNHAGSMGSAGLTFKFVNGRLVVEVHDPRWATPTIVDQSTGECSKIEIRYMYLIAMPDKHGKLCEVWHWYRRVIDATADVTYQPAMVTMEEPDWIADEAKSIPHGLGVFPGVWVQNTPALGRPDGDPDCKGLFDNSETCDRLYSQAATGAEHNADPTLHIGTSAQTLPEIRKGSRHAIRTEQGGEVGYVESSGSGSAAAIETAQEVDTISLRAARYVRLQDREGGAMTAEEVRRRCGPMIAAVSEKRTHWTQTGIVPLVERVIRGTRVTTAVVTDPAGQRRQATTTAKPLPQSLASGALDDQTLGAAGVQLKVKWPPVIKSSPVDAQAAATAAAAARSAKIIDRQSAVEFVAGAFGIDDPAEVIKRLDAEDGAAAAALESELLHQAGPPAPGDTAGAEAKAADAALNGAQVDALRAFAADAYTGIMPRANVIAQCLIAFPSSNRAMIEAAIPEPKPVPLAPGVVPGAPPAPPGAPPAPGGAAPAPAGPPPAPAAPPAPPGAPPAPGSGPPGGGFGGPPR